MLITVQISRSCYQIDLLELVEDNSVYSITSALDRKGHNLYLTAVPGDILGQVIRCLKNPAKKLFSCSRKHCVHLLSLSFYFCLAKDNTLRKIENMDGIFYMCSRRKKTA